MSRTVKSVKPTALSLENLSYIKDEQQFQQFASANDLIYIVCFTASWCGPCKQIKPFIVDLQSKYNASAKFLFVDVDENTAMAETYGIQSMPTFVAFRKNNQLVQFKGANKEQLAHYVRLLVQTAYC